MVQAPSTRNAGQAAFSSAKTTSGFIYKKIVCPLPYAVEGISQIEFTKPSKMAARPDFLNLDDHRDARNFGAGSRPDSRRGPCFPALRRATAPCGPGWPQDWRCTTPP